MVHKYCFCSQSIEYDYISASSMLSLSSFVVRPRAYFHMKGYEYFRYFQSMSIQPCTWKFHIFCVYLDMTNSAYIFLWRYIAIYHMGIKLRTIYLLLCLWLIGQYQKKIAYSFIRSYSRFRFILGFECFINNIFINFHQFENIY